MKGLNQELDREEAMVQRLRELEEENRRLKRQSFRELAAKGGRSRSEKKRAAVAKNAAKGGRPSEGKGFDWAARQAREESRVVRGSAGWRAERSVPLDGTGERQWWLIEGGSGSWGEANEVKNAWRRQRAEELRRESGGRR